MKVKIKETEKVFKPVTLDVTFESVKKLITLRCKLVDYDEFLPLYAAMGSILEDSIIDAAIYRATK